MKFSLSFAAIGMFFASNRADAFSAVSPSTSNRADAAVSPSDAQTSSILTSENIPKVAKVLKGLGDFKMFDDVQLPKSLSFDERVDYLLQMAKQSKEEDFFLSGILPGLLPELEITPASDQGLRRVIKGLAGKEKPGKAAQPRSQEFRDVYTKVINRVIKTNVDAGDPCEGYLYFGNQDYTKILPMLCQVNPFWASALTVAGCNDEYLELNAYYTASCPLLEWCHPDSKYLTIMDAMIPDPSRNINVRFNKDMTVNQIVTYESGKAVIVPEEEWSYYASGVCYNMMYYTQTIHGLIHVLHYLMTTGITQSTEHDDALAAWANPYDDNVAMKYIQVAVALVESSLPFPNDNKVLTGKFGLGGTTSVVSPLRDFLCIWGECKNEEDFTKKFLLKDLYATAKNPEEVLETADILTEFKKHLDNVEPFATELTEAMKVNDGDAFKKAEDTLTTFMSECGKDVSSIDSISSWAQLMSCTGMVHGSTLSYSRMIVMPEVMRWRDIKNPTWNGADISLMSPIVGTMQGMTEDKHVFTGEIQNGRKWDTEPISKGVQDVLDKYNLKAEELKTEYQKELEKRDDFREFGWILTDHCTDGYDGKQHTLTTYI